jgi:hypothetical protein
MKIKSLTIGEFKSQFSDVIKSVDKDHCIAVTYGKKKEVVGYFVKEAKSLYESRELGILKNEASYSISNDFEITDEELLDL